MSRGIYYFLLPAVLLTTLLAIALGYRSVSPAAEEQQSGETVRAGTDESNSGREPGEYYTRALTGKVVRVPSSFRNRADIVEFIDNRVMSPESQIFCKPSWCVALVDNGSGAYVLDVLYFEANIDSEQEKSWKLRRVYHRAVSVTQPQDLPESVDVNHTARTLTLRKKSAAELVSLQLPPPEKTR